MKTNLLKSIFISLILVMGVSNAWAYNYGGTNVYYYFANTDNWPTPDLYIWNGDWNTHFTLTQIANTKVYYHKWTSAYNNNAGILFRGEVGWSKGQTGDIYANYTSHTSWVHNSTTGKTDLSNINRSAQVAVKLSTGGNYTQTANANCVAKVSGYTVEKGNASATAKNASTSSSSATASISAAYGSTITYTATAGTGYTFKGFSTSNSTSLPSSPAASGKTATASAYGSSNNSTYYAYFKANQYTVKFDANGGTGSMSDQSHTYSVSQALTANAFTRTGYTFEGWNTKADGTGTSYPDKQSVSNLSSTDGGSVTLYAQWAEIPANNHNITYTAQATGWTYGAQPASAEEGATVTFEVIPTTGYTVTVTSSPDVSLSKNDNTYTFTMPTTDVAIDVIATENTHDVTISYKCGDQAIQANGTATAVGEITAKEITAPEITGYKFTSWTLSNGITNKSANTTTNPINITTKASGTYTLTANYEKVVTVYFVNSSKWDAVACHHWSDGGSGTSWPGDKLTTTGETVNEFDVYKATFTDQHDKCIFNNNNKGSQTGNLDVQDGKYYYPLKNQWYASLNDIPAIDPLATEVYLAGEMNGWSTIENEFRRAAKDDTNASIVLNLGKGTYKFKIMDNGTWLGNNGTINNTISGWTFVNSDGDCTLKVNIAGDYTFTWAISTKKLSVTYPTTYTITATANDAAMGTITGAGDYGKNATATLTATPNDGYLFVNWTKDDEVVATTQEYSFIVTEAVALVANFEEAPEEVHNVIVSYKCGATQIADDEIISSVGVETPTEVTAPVLAGYTFASWTLGTGIKSADETANPISINTLSDGEHTLIANYTENPPIRVYLKPNDSWKEKNARFAAYTYGNGFAWFDMTEVAGTDGEYYTCTVPAKYPNIIFVRMNPDKKENDWANKLEYQTANLIIPTDNVNIYNIATSEWEAYVGNYRLAYTESETLGLAPYTNFHPAHELTFKAIGTQKDTVSFYINKEGQNPAIVLQRCTISDAALAWNDVAILSINGNQGGNPGGAMAPAKRSVELYIGSGCQAVTGNGVYNFVVEQTDGVATILGEATHSYVGNYYIRTDAANGGWNSYNTNSDNIMTHSETALMHGGYDYYFCKWIESVSSNIKYTVANDYSLCVSDTLDGDAIATQGKLPAEANVRFTWNSETNHLERAYLAGSGNASDRFLVLEGDNNLKDVNGNQFKVSGLNSNEAIFKDLEDWQYQVDVKADNNTKVKLTAKYNNQVQYFKGSATEKVQILEGGTRAYKIRLIYDFKTNYIITALIDDEPITEEIAFEEVMIIREHHNPAQSLNITAGSITGIKNLYAVMTFYKDQLNDDTKTEHERALYWVSFPFDVKLDEAFGSGNYGEHWIMEYYDGAERAEKGGWVDATYWKLIENPTDIILEAGVGYVLCLDLDKLGKSSPVYGKSDHINIYFPSAADISTISAQALEDVEVPAHDCTINRPTPDGDRTTKDDNWNLIGVPSYSDVNSNIGKLKAGDLQFVYQYIAKENRYESQAATEFNTMHAYMVQFAGIIPWSTLNTAPAAIAARRNATGKDQYTLRLALQQEGVDHDHTFIRLLAEGVTAEFDMNADLCKIINSGANIYSMINNVEVAANVLPVEERVIPIGLDIHETGNYTFAMPDGTDGITAILIDYETGKETNLLLADYTTELREGTNNGRFALRVRPNHVATAVETLIDGANGQIQKYIINGALYILNNGQLYDAQGRMVQQ